MDHHKRSQAEAGGVIERLIRGEKNSENEDKEPQLHSCTELRLIQKCWRSLCCLCTETSLTVCIATSLSITSLSVHLRPGQSIGDKKRELKQRYRCCHLNNMCYTLHWVMLWVMQKMSSWQGDETTNKTNMTTIYSHQTEAAPIITERGWTSLW